MTPAAAAGKGRPPLLHRLARGLGGRLVVALPYFWLLFFFLAPFFIVLKISLSQTAIAIPPYLPVFQGISDIGAKIDGFALDNYRILFCDVAGELKLGPEARTYCETFFIDSFYDSPYLSAAYGTSVVVAAASTVLTLLVGYPIAYGMARAPSTLRPVLLMLVILPFWTSFLIRVYAWIGILKPEGLLNQFLLWLGVIAQPLVITNTYWAVFIGTVYCYLPFMVLPLYASLEKADFALVEAAQDLGCTPAGAFWKITFPLSLPGLVAGSLLVFIPAVGEFVIPDLLGGSQTLMIGRTLWNEFFANRDWPVSSAVAVVLLILLVVPIMWFQQAQAKAQEAGR